MSLSIKAVDKPTSDPDQNPDSDEKQYLRIKSLLSFMDVLFRGIKLQLTILIKNTLKLAIDNY